MLTCPNCGSSTRACSPVGGTPAFRCLGCSIRFVITNPSCMQQDIRRIYNALVKYQRLTSVQTKSQTWYLIYKEKKYLGRTFLLSEAQKHRDDGCVIIAVSDTAVRELQ